MRTRRRFLADTAAVAGGLAVGTLIPHAARAAETLRIAEQYGIGYLPFHIARDRGLIEKHAREAGTELAVEWVKLSGGSAMNDAVLSGAVDIGAAGVGPLLTIWDRTRGRGDVKGIAALGNMPLYLNTRNPDVRSIADLTEKDRIALPSVGVSIQARTLQMAAAAAFGEEKFDVLDTLTVTMPHPDAVVALLSGRTEINGHFTSPPFQYQELADPAVRRILSSYEVLGGPATFNAVWATSRFRAERPAAYAAFLAALGEAIDIINADKAAAAATYLQVEKSKLDPALVEKIVADPEVEFTLTPQKTEAYAAFMAKVGAIKTAPASFRDYFFDEAHALAGS